MSPPVTDPAVVMWTALLVLALGLTIGSFLNVVIHRLPRGQSVVTPRSACPSCGSMIRARDNVPVLSYLWLRGRCRDCAIPISWRYPAVEALTGGLFLGCWWLFGPSLSWLLAAGFCALMVTLALIDLDHMILPDRLTLPGVVVGIILRPWLPWGAPGSMGWWERRWAPECCSPSTAPGICCGGWRAWGWGTSRCWLWSVLSWAGRGCW